MLGDKQISDRIQEVINCKHNFCYSADPEYKICVYCLWKEPLETPTNND